MTKTDKWQTRPLVRVGAQIRQDSNFGKKNLWSKVPDWARHQDILTDWPSVVMWLWLWEQSLSLPGTQEGRPVRSLVNIISKLFQLLRNKMTVNFTDNWENSVNVTLIPAGDSNSTKHDHKSNTSNKQLMTPFCHFPLIAPLIQHHSMKTYRGVSVQLRNF
jgi:hypothetical protein